MLLGVFLLHRIRKGGGKKGEEQGYKFSVTPRPYRQKGFLEGGILLFLLLLENEAGKWGNELWKEDQLRCLGGKKQFAYSPSGKVVLQIRVR